MSENRVLGGQGEEAKRVDVKDTVLMVSRLGVTVVASEPSIVVMMVVSVGGSVMVSLGADRQGVERTGVLIRKFVRMRRLGSSTSPDKRHGHHGRYDLTHDSHDPKLRKQVFPARERD